MLTNSKIINKTMQGNLRLKVPFGVDYDSDLKKVAKVTLSLAKKTPGILESPEPMVIVKEFGESSINMELRVWLQPEKDSTVALRNNLIVKITEEFKKNKIKIPYPHLELVK
jgi:small-conductance mechanosensitive channel